MGSLIKLTYILQYQHSESMSHIRPNNTIMQSTNQKYNFKNHITTRGKILKEHINIHLPPGKTTVTHTHSNVNRGDSIRWIFTPARQLSQGKRRTYTSLPERWHN